MLATAPLPQTRRAVPTRRWLALAVLCISLLITVLDTLVLNVALPTLVRVLHATSTQLAWIVDAYVLVFVGLLLVAGSLADRFGRQRMFLVGLAAFAAGSAWAAYSGSVGMLIAARASMGIGGALIMPSTLSIITDMFREEVARQRAFGIWAATLGAGGALGPVVGGLLLAHFWWGSVFLVNVPIAAIGFVCAIWLVPESKNPDAPRPDILGSALSIAGVGLLLWAIIDAPVEGWTSGLVVGAGMGGLVLLAGFVLWEAVSPSPMLRVSFFRNRRFSAAILSVSLVMFSLFGALFELTQWLQFDLGYTALQTGVRILPAAGAIVVVAPLSAPLQRAIGTKLTTAAGLLMVAGGLWQISGATVATTYAEALLGIVPLGIGAVLVIPSVTGAVMGSLPREHAGVGSATNNAFLQLGGALGVAVIGSLLTTHYQSALTSSLAAYPVLHGSETAILGSIGGALGIAQHVGGLLGQALSRMACSAFMGGMDVAFFIGAIVALAGALVALIALPSRQVAAGGGEALADPPERARASGQMSVSPPGPAPASGFRAGRRRGRSGDRSHGPS
jgi:EmrB/QacA subfamily drug resistance transporter